MNLLAGIPLYVLGVQGRFNEGLRPIRMPTDWHCIVGLEAIGFPIGGGLMASASRQPCLQESKTVRAFVGVGPMVSGT